MTRDSFIHKEVAGAPGGPLLFVFHGTGGDENQFLGLGRHLLPDATIVSPRGDVSEHGAARFFRRTGEGVYDMEDLARATQKMTAFIETHRDDKKPSAIVGLGYSNGANILASVLFARPGLFGSAVLMHPLIPFEPEVAGKFAGTQILITAGRHDPICPAPLTERLAGDFARHGATVEMLWHDGGHEVRPAEMEAAQRFLTRDKTGAAS